MNGGEQTAEFVYLIGSLILVGSALVARRMPIAQNLKMFAGWVLIFGILFGLFALKDDIIGVAGRVVDEGRAEQGGVRQGEDLRIKQGSDGHFWVTGELNGQSVRFLIDSGATTTSISSATAERAGISTGGGFPVLVGTANGTVRAQRGRAGTLQVGHIKRQDFAVLMSDAFGETNVLGMNFLSSLSGWRVEGRNLILTP